MGGKTGGRRGEQKRAQLVLDHDHDYGDGGESPLVMELMVVLMVVVLCW